MASHLQSDRYAVYRLGTSRDTILRGTTNRTYYLDFVETTDTTYTYRVVALDPSGKALYTTPDVSASVRHFTDDQLQEMVQRYTFRYFWSLPTRSRDWLSSVRTTAAKAASRSVVRDLASWD